MKTACQLLSLSLLSVLLFQGCAVYPPPQPVYYPPPATTIPNQPIPDTDLVRPAPTPPPQRPNAIAAEFSRQATEQARQGRLNLAAATLERGLRASPKNAKLWSQLAEIELQQDHYLQARSLAAKSNSLAGTDTAIIEKNQWIIRESLKRAAGQ